MVGNGNSPGAVLSTQRGGAGGAPVSDPSHCFGQDSMTRAQSGRDSLAVFSLHPMEEREFAISLKAAIGMGRVGDRRSKHLSNAFGGLRVR